MAIVLQYLRGVGVAFPSPGVNGFSGFLFDASEGKKRGGGFDSQFFFEFAAGGLKVVFEYDDNTNYWLTIPDRARATVWSNRLEVPIESPNAEKVRAVFVGWFEDFNDYQAGKVTGGDMFGVLDFWVPTAQVAATSKSGAKRR